MTIAILHQQGNGTAGVNDW